MIMINRKLVIITITCRTLLPPWRSQSGLRNNWPFPSWKLLLHRIDRQQVLWPLQVGEAEHPCIPKLQANCFRTPHGGAAGPTRLQCVYWCRGCTHCERGFDWTMVFQSWLQSRSGKVGRKTQWDLQQTRREARQWNLQHVQSRKTSKEAMRYCGAHGIGWVWIQNHWQVGVSKHVSFFLRGGHLSKHVTILLTSLVSPTDLYISSPWGSILLLAIGLWACAWQRAHSSFTARRIMLCRSSRKSSVSRPCWNSTYSTIRQGNSSDSKCFRLSQSILFVFHTPKRIQTNINFLWIQVPDDLQKILLGIISGFGSGDFITKTEASDVISDTSGRWVRFDLTGRADECPGTYTITTKHL